MDAQRELKVAVATVAAAYLATAAFWVAQAPAGSWWNHIFEFVMWSESDPGGWYVPAAHELFDHPGRSCFAGHPGIPLVFLLSAEQWLFYGMARLFGSPLEFTPFIARHTVLVWAAAKLTMAVLHLASFVSLYAFARAILRRRDLAFLAVGIYMTSFPVAYYQTRVSVEPVANIFFFGTLIALIRVGQTQTGEGARALRWAAAAGFLAVSAFFTKIHIMAPWPAFAGVWLLVAAVQGPGVTLRRRLVAGLAYGGGCLAAAVLFAPFTDWQSLRYVWEGSGAAAASLSTFQFFTVMLSRVVGGVFAAFGQLHILQVLPAANRSTGFFYFEFVFLCAALAGLVLFLRRAGRSERRTQLLALVYGLVVSALWFYRSFGTDFHGFHYLFPVVGLLSPLAALAVAALVPGLADPARPRGERALLMAATILALHASGLLAVFHSKCQDLLRYPETGASFYEAALEKLPAGGRIAVIGKEAHAFHGLSDSYAMPDRRSRLVAELKGLYLERIRPKGDVAPLAADLREHDVAWVIDFTLGDPGPLSIDDWSARASR